MVVWLRVQDYILNVWKVPSHHSQLLSNNQRAHISGHFKNWGLQSSAILVEYDLYWEILEFDSMILVVILTFIAIKINSAL